MREIEKGGKASFLFTTSSIRILNDSIIQSSIRTIDVQLIEQSGQSKCEWNTIGGYTHGRLHGIDVTGLGTVLSVGCHALVHALIESLIQTRAISVNRRARAEFQQRHNGQECAVLRKRMTRIISFNLCFNISATKLLCKPWPGGGVIRTKFTEVYYAYFAKSNFHSAILDASDYVLIIIIYIHSLVTPHNFFQLSIFLINISQIFKYSDSFYIIIILTSFQSFIWISYVIPNIENHDFTHIQSILC